MKAMKAKIRNSPFTVNVVPEYSDGWFVGFSDINSKFMYRPEDLVFIDESKSSELTWEDVDRIIWLWTNVLDTMDGTKQELYNKVAELFNKDNK